MIRNVVSKAIQGHATIIVNETNLDQLNSEDKLVIAFSSANELAQKGLLGIDVKDIIKKVMEQEEVSCELAESIIKKCYIDKTTISSKHYVPIFYFTKKCSNFDNDPKILNLKQRTLQFVEDVLKNRSIPNLQNIQEVNKFIMEEGHKTKNLPALVKAYAKNNISYNEYIKILSSSKFKDASNFRQAITYADLK